MKQSVLSIELPNKKFKEITLMYKKLFLQCMILIASTMIGCTSTPKVNSENIEVRTEDIKARIAFHEQDREAIISYYSHKIKSKSLPPGLAKKDALPPGLQRHK